LESTLYVWKIIEVSSITYYYQSLFKIERLMKNCKLFFTLGFVAVMSVSALAQTTATINVTAELLEGLQIDPVADLDLGSFLLLDSNPGILEIDPSDGTLAITNLAVVTDPTLGSFRVLGSDGVINVAIQGSATLTDGVNSDFSFSTTAYNGSEFFTVDGANIAGDATISSGVSQTISIGGTLDGIEPTDDGGSYSGTINITVSYQ
jgi:hypothetical protein